MLPKNLKYGNKVESALARSYKTNIQPQNGTGPYNVGDTIIFNIPTRNNLLNCPTENYLKFTATATSGAVGGAWRWDSCGAHGLFQRIRIFHGSNLIQDIDNYNQLAKLLFDIQVSPDASYGKYNVLAGTRNDLYVDTAIKQALPANSGERIGGAGVALTTAPLPTASETYCINLISFLGTLCANQYIPLFAMTSAPLRLEITLASNTYQAISELVATTTLQMSNVEFVAQFIELSDNGMDLVAQNIASTGEPLQFCYSDFKNYGYSVNLPNGATTEISMPIPAKFSSLKSIFLTVRDKGLGATGGYFPQSSVSHGIKSYYFRLGSQVIPTKAPSTTAEMFAEVCKAIACMSDINHTPSIDKTAYSLATSVVNNDTAAVTSSVNSGSFYIGLGLENYDNAPKDQMYAGYNSLTDDIYFVGSFNNPGNTASSRFDAFANFDVVFVCENGTAYVKF
jgi:hypothetical protein